MLDQYKKAVKIAQMGLWEWDIVTNEVMWSDEKFILFGYEPNEFPLNMETAFNTVHPDDIAHIGKALDDNLPTEHYFEYCYRGVKKSGDIIHVWVRVQVERNSKGEPIKVYGISQDRTKQIHLEDEVRELNKNLEFKVKKRTDELEKKNDQNELLVKEMHHRVKNNLQVVSSILNLQKRHIKDDDTVEALSLCVKRIKSMAIIHDSLYSSDDHSKIQLDKYINNLVDVYKTETPVTFNLNIEEAVLGLDNMVPIALIINELVANSCNHAFKDMENGKISIDLKIDNKFHLIYQDNGKGIDVHKKNERPSFGMEMIKTLCEGMESEYSVESKSGEGFKFECSSTLDTL